MLYRFEIEDKQSSNTIGYFIGIGRFELVDPEINNLLDKLSEDLIAPEICKDETFETVSYYTELGYKKYKKYLLKLCMLINKSFNGLFEMKQINISPSCIVGDRVYEDELQVTYMIGVVK